MLRRIYYFKAGKPVSKENPVYMLRSWTDDKEKTSTNKLLIKVKIKNLTNCVFLSKEDPFDIDKVIYHLLGVSYSSPGLYKF